MTWSDRYPPGGLTPYDTRWPHHYADLAGGLGAALGPGWELEHVGSTSVPGLAAKPVIDLAVRIPSGIDLAESSGLFDHAGWSTPRPLGDHAASFRLVDGVRSAIAHIFTDSQWPEAHVRLFADWLRHHPVDRDRYHALKTDLVRSGAWQEGGYTAAKSAFVLDVVNQARGARGLPSVIGPL